MGILKLYNIGMRLLLSLFLVLGLCISSSAQITPFGYDENDASNLYVIGDPRPKVKIGTTLDFEWMFDLWMEGWSGLVLGADTPVRANLCWYSQDPIDLLNKWLLVAPMWHLGYKHGAEGWWNYSLRIPNDPILVGTAFRVQAFYQADEWVGHTPCARLRGTNGLRIQLSSH